MRAISIIVPTRNEEGNIILLIKRIDEVMQKHNITYEIIFIDDHSVDLTQDAITKLKKLYPVQLHIKKGKRGKAQSLIEGFSYAQYPVLAMIDADLQYPPEIMPKMYEKVIRGDGVVVADRKEKRTNFLRSTGSKTCLFVFGKLLHGLDVDVQSGLKIFKKEIIERLHLNPSPWSFDLEFLVKARNAGYTITSVPMVFEKRHAGKSKVNMFNTAWQIAIDALQLKFTKQEVIPFHKEALHKKGQGFHYKGKEFVHFTNLDVSESAFFQTTGKQKITILSIIMFFAIGLAINWRVTFVSLITTLTIIYFTDLLFNFFLILQSFLSPAEIFIKDEDLQKTENWPSYTIFCPLYKEGNVIPQFIDAIERINYPKEKLQVILLLEEDDRETIKMTEKLQLPRYVEVRIPPHSFPKTKPKALNFGLQYATGEYCVVYDAEDIPDPLQLKKVVVAFSKTNKKIKCIQAKLNFYNPFQNLLTRVFTAEYSLWFDLILTGLQSSHSIIPLGGTSNHFPTKELQIMQGWDSFNVTEDCDLGLRLVKHGYQTAIVNSTTLEEANSDVFNWFNQRGRWIKGYMQTYLVHARDPKAFIEKAKLKQFISFQLVIGGKIMSIFINPLMWIITIAYFAFRAYLGTFIESFFPTPVLYMGVLCLVFGNFMYLYYYMIGCARRGHYSLIKYAFLVPLYWLGMSISGWTALYKIITQPHYWAKTHHGLHLQKKQKETSIEPTVYRPQLSIEL